MSFRVSEVLRAAEREAELEKQVLSSHPDLIGRLEEGKKTLEKDTQERYKLTNRWFDMSGEDFQKYLSHSTNVNESPVSPIITVVLNGMKLLAQNVQGITIPNSGHWIPEERASLSSKVTQQIL